MLTITLFLVLLSTMASVVINLTIARSTQEIHTLVNSRMTSVLQRVEQLTIALERSDIEVPPDPNPTD